MGCVPFLVVLHIHRPGSAVTARLGSARAQLRAARPNWDELSRAELL